MPETPSSAPAQIWTIEAILRWATDDFRAKKIESPRLDAELLLALAIGSTRMQLIIDSKRPLVLSELARFRDLVKRRRAHEPIAYLRGEREFFGRSFRVDKRVLIPRPDTETLVDVALSRTRDCSLSMRAADICSGSGCITITLAKERPTASLTGTDISPGAIAVAQENALRLGAYNASFRLGDLYAPLSGRYDLIASNPPYIVSSEIATLDADVRDHEPRLALDGGDDGLAIMRRVVAGASAYLTESGVLAVEVGAGEAPDVARLFENEGFREIAIAKDYARIERVVSGVRPSGTE